MAWVQRWKYNVCTCNAEGNTQRATQSFNPNDIVS